MKAANSEPKPKEITKCSFEEGDLDTKILDFDELEYGHVDGPAIIVDKNWWVDHR